MGESIRAIWQGPFAAEMPNGTVLQPGDEHLVTEGDLESAHWKRVGGKPNGKPKPDQRPEPENQSSEATA